MMLRWSAMPRCSFVIKLPLLAATLVGTLCLAMSALADNQGLPGKFGPARVLHSLDDSSTIEFVEWTFGKEERVLMRLKNHKNDSADQIFAFDTEERGRSPRRFIWRSVGQAANYSVADEGKQTMDQGSAKKLWTVYGLTGSYSDSNRYVERGPGEESLKKDLISQYAKRELPSSNSAGVQALKAQCGVSSVDASSSEAGRAGLVASALAKLCEEDADYKSEIGKLKSIKVRAVKTPGTEIKRADGVLEVLVGTLPLNLEASTKFWIKENF
ncbi:MAG TPA: hypothetical protein PLZ57_16260 [Pseudobdellovibrionaceae bacterium]|nr:hypothetical protein [Pseudobdellovibrionaceae bacterium]